MARKKEEAVAEKQAAQDGKNAVRCQRGREGLEGERGDSVHGI